MAEEGQACRFPGSAAMGPPCNGGPGPCEGRECLQTGYAIDVQYVTTKSMQWGEETLTLETGKVARQADGSVIATLGETSSWPT
jgi:hypothetical protein